MATTLGDAKINIKLDFGGAKIPGAEEGKPKEPEKPEREERREPNPGKDGASGGDGADGNDGAFHPYDTAKRIGRAAYSGGLYGESLALVGTVPVLGTAVRAAELVRQYGPAAAAVVRSLAESLPEGPGRDAAIAAATQALEVARTTAAALNEVKVHLDALTDTVQASKDLAVGQSMFGGVDAGEIGKFAGNNYAVDVYMARLRAVQEQRGNERIGDALGQAGGDALNRLFAGSSGR